MTYLFEVYPVHLKTLHTFYKSYLFLPDQVHFLPLLIPFYELLLILLLFPSALLDFFEHVAMIFLMFLLQLVHLLIYLFVPFRKKFFLIIHFLYLPLFSFLLDKNLSDPFR